MQRRNLCRTLGVLVSDFPEQSEESYDHPNSEREQQDKAASLSEIRFPLWGLSRPIIFDFSVPNIGHQNRLRREKGMPRFVPDIRRAFARPKAVLQRAESVPPGYRPAPDNRDRRQRRVFQNLAEFRPIFLEQFAVIVRPS